MVTYMSSCWLFDTRAHYCSEIEEREKQIATLLLARPRTRLGKTEQGEQTYLDSTHEIRHSLLAWWYDVFDQLIEVSRDKVDIRRRPLSFSRASWRFREKTCLA